MSARLLLASAGLLVLTGCGPAWHTLRANGVTVRYPSGWSATALSLTYVSSPTQAFAVASYPLPRGPEGADGCQPTEALDRMPDSGALIYGWEYATSQDGFRRRPAHFTLTRRTGYECLGRSYVLRFRQADRFFQIHVVLGSRANGDTRKNVLRILDSFTAGRIRSQ